MTRFALATWLRRSGSSASKLWLTVVLSSFSSLLTMGLVVGSGALLADAFGQRSLLPLTGFLIVIEFFAFFQAPLRYQEKISSHRRAVYATVSLRLWLLDEIAKRIPGSLSSFASGELLNASMADLETLEGIAVSVLSPLLAAGSGVAIALAALCVVDAGVARAFAVAAAVMVVIIATSSIPLRQLTRAEFAARARSTTAHSDFFGGLDDLKMAGMDKVAVIAIEAEERKVSHIQTRTLQLRASVMASASVVLAGTTGFVIRRLSSQHLGGVDAVVTVLLVVVGLQSCFSLLTSLEGWARVRVASERLNVLVETPLEPSLASTSSRWPQEAADIVVSDLHLGFDAESPDIINGADFCLPTQSITVLRGPSGAGKSTLASAIMGIVQAQSGSIMMGDTDLDTLSIEQRWKHCSMVDQHPVLFGSTLRDVLTLSAPSATEQECCDVLTLLGLGRYANAEGLAQQTGDGGTTFSGGELRLIGIARALLRQPDLLILDEPTVGLDNDLSARLEEVIESISATTSVLIISHETDLAFRHAQQLWLDDGIVTTLSD